MDATMAAQLKTIAANHGGEVLGLGRDRFGKMLKVASQISCGTLGLGLAARDCSSFRAKVCWFFGLESFDPTMGAGTVSFQRLLGSHCSVGVQVLARQEFRNPHHTSITQMNRNKFSERFPSMAACSCSASACPTRFVRVSMQSTRFNELRWLHYEAWQQFGQLATSDDCFVVGCAGGA